jgi:hypothetical protein
MDEQQGKNESEQDLMGCISQYDKDNNDKISKELRTLVSISQEHQELQLKTNVQDLKKYYKGKQFMN